jgi:tetratricopeptide (TPR) repeat protein
VRRTVGVVLLAAAAGCAPALREPPSLATLATRPAPAASAHAPTLRAQADAAWARRPDPAAVREAEALYFEAAQADETDIEGLVGAVRAKAWLADHGGDSKTRDQLAVSAVQTAQWCVKRKPEAGACDYWLAIAVGLQARENRETADDGLKTMVVELNLAIDRDPTYDEAGPHRVMAILLTRAPSWPLGPGDLESALEHAQKAIELAPAFPPNTLALGEALAAAKQRGEARDAYARARSLAVGKQAAGDPDAVEWVAQADAALAKIKP